MNDSVTSAQIGSTLCWIESRFAFFNAFPNDAPDYAKLKAFGELALAYMYLAAWKSCLRPEIVPTVDRFLGCCSRFLQEQCERSVYVEAARKDPLQGYAYILPYLALRSQGFRSPVQERLLRWLRQFGLPMSVECNPYRQWERQLLLWKGGLRAHPPSCRIHYGNTSLAMRRGSLYINTEEAYAITHTIFYMTDFGLEIADVSDPEKSRIGILLRSLLIHYLRKENWDLSCELLMCMYQLRFSEDSLMTEAANLFTRVRRDDGSMPAHGPGFSGPLPRRRKRVSKRPPEERYTLDCYHPTLVWLFYAFTRGPRHGEQ